MQETYKLMLASVFHSMEKEILARKTGFTIALFGGGLITYKIRIKLIM